MFDLSAGFSPTNLPGSGATTHRDKSMPTQKNRKKQLVAAAKRRSRRLAAAEQRRAPHPVPSAGPAKAVDVSGLIARTILDYSGSRGSRIGDAVVIAALRSCFQGTTPSGEDSRGLYQQLAEIPSRYGVQMQAFRKEIDGMLSLAKRQRDADHEDAFLKLLQTLTQ